jgi:hypothetical protein
VPAVAVSTSCACSASRRARRPSRPSRSAVQGVLEALRGRTEAARRMLASSRTMVEELGISHRLFETDVFRGP